MEEELAFLKAQFINLPPAVFRQLKREIILEKKMTEAVTAAKAPGSGEGPTGLDGGCQSGLAGVEPATPQKDASKRKANELELFSCGGSLEPVLRRPAPGPLPMLGPRLCMKIKRVKIALGTRATPTGEQAVKSSRQICSAKM